MNAINKSLKLINNLSWIHVVVIGASLTGMYFLWDRYQEQVFSFWPYLFLLLCPLMHIFMHKGHGSHGNHKDHKSDQE